MQVVYSGGSSTPTPSPRLQRKALQGYGRPVMPGYLSGPSNPVIVTRSKEKLTEGDASLRDSIPAMSKSLAVACLVFNIFLPGFGTLMAGLSVLCCSQVRPKGASRRSVVWTNSYVALMQFLTTFIFFLGWIWAIMWGAAFLSISAEYEKSKASPDGLKPKNGHGGKTSPRRQHPSPGATSDGDGRHHHSNGSPAAAAANSSHHHHHPHHPHQQQQQQQHKRCNYEETYAPPAAGAAGASSSNSTSTTTQPIIVLQEAPILNQNDLEHRQAPSRPLMNARTRHQKILQRQMSDNELSPFVLTHERLEALVIHDLPVPRPRYSREGEETVVEELETPDESLPSTSTAAASSSSKT